MVCTDLSENFETGLFERADGRRFVRCEFNPQEPQWIDVSGNLWSTIYAGTRHVLDWRKLVFAAPVTFALQTVIQRRLKVRSPSYMAAVEFDLLRLQKAADRANIRINDGFFGISASDWLGVWLHLDRHSRSFFRSIYTELANEQLAGADFAIAVQLKQWKSIEGSQTLRRVMEWDAKSGPFTSHEWELIRRVLNSPGADETDADCAIRIFGCVLNETLKRPIQVLSMKRDALWIAPSGREFFLRIPKAKAQTGERPALWQITQHLAESIQAYSQRPKIRELQGRLDRLIVAPRTHNRMSSTMKYGQVGGSNAAAKLRIWAERQGIISPRTRNYIRLLPYRIRHTGATAMALQGVARDEIQEILEHDSPCSADAYIKAVGSDLMPALERATDRGVGEVFSELRRLYFFKGTVVETVGRRPIHIPIVVENVAQPAVVGSCGKSVACKWHPLWACYNGCPHFLAWRNGPHQKSLEFVESELKRWSDVEGGKERSKLGKDFDRVGAAIREVIGQIEEAKEEQSKC